MLRPVAALLVYLLAGCTALLGPANTEPVVNLEAWPVEGFAPLTVRFNFSAYDPDGDALTTQWIEEPGGLISRSSIPRATSPPPAPGHGEKTYLVPGQVVVTYSVSDGVHVVNKTITILVRSASNLPGGWLNFTAPVSQNCGSCSGGVPPYVGTVSPLGANACAGFLRNQNRTDCVWFSLPQAVEGIRYFANATQEADADLEFRTACTIDADSLGIDAHEGPEDGDLPAGARCVILWTYYSLGTLELQIGPTY